MAARRGWTEVPEKGLRCVHITACPNTEAEERVVDCKCPYSWTLSWPDPENPTLTKQRPHTFHGTLAQARRAKAKLRIKADEARDEARLAPRAYVARHRESEVRTCYEHFLDWQKRTEAREGSANTVYQRDQAWLKLHDRWATVPLDLVTRPDVVDDVWKSYAELVDPETDAGYRTFDTRFKTLSEMLNDAVKCGLLQWNPASKKNLSYPTRKRKRIKPQQALTHEQLHVVLDVCRTPVKRAHRTPLACTVFVGLAVELLMRRGEVAALDVHHIDFSSGEVHVQDNIVQVKDYRGVHLPKDRDERFPVLSDGLRDLIVEHVAATYGNRLPKVAPLFPYGRRKDGRFMAPWAVDHWMARISKRAALTDVRTGAPLHVNVTRLRKTGMALLAGEGVPVRLISDHAGHEEVRTTESNYLRDRTDREPLKAVSAVFGKMWAERGAAPDYGKR